MAAFEIVALDTATPQLRGLSSADTYRFPQAFDVKGQAFFDSEGANVFAQRNGTAAQTHRIYNTFTDASNHERAFLRWASNVFEIGTERAGTGAARNMRIISGFSTSIWGSFLTLATEGGIVCGTIVTSTAAIFRLVDSAGTPAWCTNRLKWPPILPHQPPTPGACTSATTAAAKRRCASGSRLAQCKCLPRNRKATHGNPSDLYA